MTENPTSAFDERPHKIVLGPEGYPISRSTLPSPKNARWVARRKAEILAAIKGGLLTASEACEQYRLSPEELDAWKEAERSFGLTGLRTLFRTNRRSTRPDAILRQACPATSYKAVAHVIRNG